MNTYQYVQKGGGLGTIDAATPEAAINAAPNRDPNSGVISPPMKNEVSTLSTTQGQNIVNQATTEHAADMTRLTTGQQTQTKTDTTTPKAPEGSLSWDEAQGLGLDMNSLIRDPATNTFLPSENTKQQAATQDKLKTDETEINNAFSQAGRDADASTQSLIGSISSLYDALFAEQRDINKRTEQTLNTSQIRSGTNRYAGEVANGILNAEQRAGLMKISELAAKKSQAIAGAESALQDKKYSLFIAKRDELKKARSDMHDQLQKLQDQALATQKKNKEQIQQSSRDSAIAGLMEQGITDPSQLLNYLNFDQNGNQVGDFTSKEVGAALKNLAPEDNLKSLTGSTKNFYALKQRGMLPESIAKLPEGQQLFSYLRQEKQATTIYKNSTTGGGKETVKKPEPALIDQGMKDLHDPRVFGSDGYSDPFFYKAKYDAWIQDGYSPQDFIKYYPPKTYINPVDNHFLPSYLQTTAKVPKDSGVKA